MPHTLGLRAHVALSDQREAFEWLSWDFLCARSCLHYCPQSHGMLGTHGGPIATAQEGTQGGSTPVPAWLCTATLTATLCVLQAQPWESMGTRRLPKAHGDCTTPGTRPAARDGQSQHASRAARTDTTAFPGHRQLHSACGQTCPCPHCPAAQEGDAPRAAPVQAAAPLRSSPTAWSPRPGGAQGAGVLPSGAGSGAGALHRRGVARGSLRHLPWLRVSVAVPTLCRGWFGDHPTVVKAAPKPRSQLMDAASSGHHEVLFPALSSQEPGTEDVGAQHTIWGGFCPSSQLGAPGGGAGAGCRGSLRRCTICFLSGCWERRGCRSPAAGRGCDRWSVYHVSALLRMLVFACKRHFWAQLLPPPSLSSCFPPDPCPWIRMG